MTARERFLASTHPAKVAEMVSSESFSTAAEAALCIMVEEGPDPADVAKGWDSWSQLRGAQKFLDLLKTIHVPIQPPKPVKAVSLHYDTLSHARDISSKPKQ